jgi:uncharacterized domain HDIG
MSSQARPGMVVAVDIYSSSSHLIIPQNSVLTDRAITRLQFYQIREITILVKEKVIVPAETEPVQSVPLGQSYSEQIKNTTEFQHFNDTFQKSIGSYESILSNFVSNHLDQLDVNALLDITNEILYESRNGIHVFHMLQCMRNFDDLTFAHSLNVAIICNIFGKWLNFSDPEIDTLTLCGLLHDIGKILIPKNILAKPESLTDQEYLIMKTHPTRGYNLLKDLNIDSHIKYAALMHHEKCDGSGYPNNLKSDRIDDYAKIITIVDVYEAMTSTRVYRNALCPFDVISIFEAEGLQKYDPKYLLSFLKGVVESYLHNRVRLSDEREGEIIMINPRFLSKPVVQVGEQFLDLSKESRLSIQAII